MRFWRRKATATDPSRTVRLHRCSFCNKSSRDVLKLVAGPGVNICSECVEICKDVVDRDVVLDPGESPEELEKRTRELDAAQANFCGLCRTLFPLGDMVKVGARGWVCKPCVSAVREASLEG